MTAYIPHAVDQTGSSPSPQVWLLTPTGAGDNNQLLALAEALGWPYETKQLAYRADRPLTKLISKRLFLVTRSGIDRRRSSALAPPWPDLVISAGRHSEPVARWIRRQSGGRSRLVHLGRSWAPLRAFDLIITTPQFDLPARANILKNDLPLHRVTPARLQVAAERWAPRLEYLKRPYTAVLVGGDSGSFVLTPDKARRMGRLVNRLAMASAGSVLITDSARTPADCFDTLCRELTVPTHRYRWADGDPDNPYLGYLALADRLVVTGESVSMLSEASATGKPLFIFDIDNATREDAAGAPAMLFRSPGRWLAKRIRPRRTRRHIGKVQQRLVASGRARWLEEPLTDNEGVTAVQHSQRDVQRAVARIRELLQC